MFKSSEEEDSDDEADSGSDDGSSSGSSSDESEAPAPKKRKAEADPAPVTPAAKKVKADLDSSVPVSKNLFIGNLSWNIDEEWLTREFEVYGELAGVRIISDRETGRSKGYVSLSELIHTHKADSILALATSNMSTRPMLRKLMMKK